MQVLETMLPLPQAECREDYFEDLYEKAFPVFARFASKMNASFEDARDVFHDAMVIYLEKCAQPGFAIKSAPEAYLVGIARHLWYKKFQREGYRLSIDSVTELQLPEEPAGEELKLLAFVELTGRRCMELLHQFYFEKVSLRVIAASLGYRTEHSAAVQKFKCIAKVRDALKAKAINYEDFNR